MRKMKRFLSAAMAVILLGSSFPGSVSVLGAENSGLGETTAVVEEIADEGSTLDTETASVEEPDEHEDASDIQKENETDDVQDINNSGSDDQDNVYEEETKEISESEAEFPAAVEQEEAADAKEEPAAETEAPAEEMLVEEPDAEEKKTEEMPVSTGRAYFVIEGNGGTVNFYDAENNVFLSAETKEGSLSVEDAYGDSARISQDGADVIDKNEQTVFSGNGLMLDGAGSFVVENDGILYEVVNGSLQEIETEDGVYPDVSEIAYYDDAAQIGLVGEEPSQIRYSAQPSEGFLKDGYEIPSGADFTETENGYMGTADLYGKEKSAGNTYRFSFVEDSDKEEEITVQTEEEVVSKEALNATHRDEGNITVTFDANGHTFDDGTTQNTMTYAVPEHYVSSTPNISSTGKQIENNYPSGARSTDTVTIDGADKLYVTVTYGTENSRYDWVCVYDGTVTPSASNYDSSVSKKLGSMPIRTNRYEITGDTAKFYFRSDSSGSAYYGYFATVSAEKYVEPELTSGEYKKPAESDMVKFIQWNTKADGTGDVVDVSDFKPTEDATLYAQYRTYPPSSEYNVKYDANGGKFENGETEKTVKYTVKRSKSSNVDNEGRKTGPYLNNSAENHIVTIDGADKLAVKIRYATESAYSDWVCVYDGSVTPSASNYSSSVSKRLGGTTETVNEYTINGDTAQFYFKTNNSGNDYYGYFAEIAGASEGSYEVPQKDASRLTGWNTKADGTGETIQDPEKHIWTEDTVLYAQYEARKDGVLFEDNTFIVMDAGTDIEVYIAEHGQVVETYTDLEHNFDPFGGQTYRTSIEKVIFDTDISPDGSNGAPLYWFNSMRNLKEIENIDRVDTSNIKNLTAAFYGCSSLKKLDLNSWDVSHVTTLSSTFNECSGLEALNISAWDTSAVTSLDAAFRECRSLKSLNVRNWNTGAVTSMSDTFNRCSGLKSLDLNSWDVSHVRTLSTMFNSCTGLTSLNLSKWNTSSVTSFSYPFNGCSGLKMLNISGWDMSKSEGMDSGFFASINANGHMIIARNIILPSSQKALNIGGSRAKKMDFSGWHTENLTSFSIFGSNLETLNISRWDTGNVTKLGFSGNSSLTEITGIETLDTSSLIDARGAFGSCSKLKNLDLSGWNTKNLEDAKSMFGGCSGLESLNVSTWDTKKLKDASSMFGSCKKLRTIDLSGWNTNAVTTMSNIMDGCESLDTLVLGENFQFVQGQSGLPYPDWVHVKTDTKVADLWSNYDNENLPGTYKRIEMLTELTTENMDDITYDNASGEITVYVDSDPYMTPVNIDVLSLYNGIRLDPGLAAKNPELKALLEKAVADGTYEDLDLKLTYRVRTYADITSCSKSENVIWTFNVPKENDKVIRTDIYKCDGTDRTYVGYIMNSEDAPGIFVLYDASGNAKQTITANTRHTYNDIGFGRPETEQGRSWFVNGKMMTDTSAAEPVYPEYEKYITYNKYMDNYEVVMAPGKYVFETTDPKAIGMQLTPISPTTDEEGQEIYSSYTFDTPEATDYASVTMFNKIKYSAQAECTEEWDKYGVFIKKDAATGNTVAGAVYKLTSAKTGTVYYQITDRDGKIGSDTGIPTLYTEYLGNKQMGGTIYRPALYEEFIVEEIEAPAGYYINPEKVEVCFWQDHTTVHYIDYARMIYQDGISDTKENTERKSYCTTCMSDHDRCVCGDYGNCSCSNCGTQTYNHTTESENYEHKDRKRPSLNITKKDAKGNVLPGAVMQLIEKATGEVLDEWTSADQAHTFTFAESGSGKIAYGETGKTFIIREKTPPANYLKAEDIEVTLSYLSGTVNKTMIDVYAPHEVIISKTDINGHEIDGAQLKVTGRETGASADIAPIQWVSEEGKDKTINLKPGTYTLHEEAVPEGGVYVLASDITFTVDINGNVKVADQDVDKVTMIDVYAPHEVIISKTDINGHEIDGAQLKVTGRETGASADITPIQWVSEEGKDKTINLKPGTYTLHEEAVPEGGVYVLASDITFTVDKDGKVKVADKDVEKVTMIDDYNIAPFKVEKTVSGNMGDRSREFDFTVTLKDNKNAAYARPVSYKKGNETGTFMPNPSGEVVFKLAHGETIEFTDLIIGTKYEVSEADYSSDGYTTNSRNASGTIVKTTASARFVNSRGSTIPTGADYAFPWILGLITAAGTTSFAVIKRRKKRGLTQSVR